MNNNKNKVNPLFSDEFMNSLLESTRKYNQFKDHIKQSLIDNSLYNFTLTCKTYYDESLITHKGDEKDTKISLIKSLSSIFIEFINSKEFNDKNIIKYHNIISEELPAVISLVLLWTQGKRDCTFELLKTQSYDLTSTSYDNIIDILNPYKDNINLPIITEEKNKILSDQKDEFLFYQKRFSLFNELSKLPNNGKSANKIKI